MKSVPDCYKNQDMCNKPINNYCHALEFAPECYKTKKMCNKAVNVHPSPSSLFLNALRLKKYVIKQLICFYVFDSIPDRYKTQEMCDRVVSGDPFLYSILP